MRQGFFLQRLCRLAPALSLLAAGCFGSAPPPGDAAPVVTVSEPAQKDITDYLDFAGKTAAVESVQLRARVGGYLEKVNYKEGDEVKKDQVLFEIDPRPFQLEVEQAQAKQARAETNAKQAEATYQRSLDLRKTNSISEEDLEKDLRSRDVAAESIDAAKANVAAKKLNLGFTKVLAPIDGRAEKANITAGNVVVASPVGGTILTTIVTIRPMYVYFDVDELTGLRIERQDVDGKGQPHREEGRPVLLGLANGSNFPYAGTIDFVGNQVTPSKGIIQARGVFANEDGALAPGLEGRVRLPLGGARSALLVTEPALGTNHGQKYVYVINDKNEVVYRPVTVGDLHEGLREITQGLAPSDRVIIKGLLRVRPGITVDPKPGKMVAEAARTGVPPKAPEAK
jgi:RND family efflux transporter MFP subunit